MLWFLSDEKNFDQNQKVKGQNDRLLFKESSGAVCMTYNFLQYTILMYLKGRKIQKTEICFFFDIFQLSAKVPYFMANVILYIYVSHIYMSPIIGLIAK